MTRAREGKALTRVLDGLAEIRLTAFSLGESLKPLSDDDCAAVAAPLTMEQIEDGLKKIRLISTLIALMQLNATSQEWLAANELSSDLPALVVKPVQKYKYRASRLRR